MLTDTHCHLFYEQLKNDLSSVLSRANEMNVTRFICVGTNINDSKLCLSITENHENIFKGLKHVLSISKSRKEAETILMSYVNDITLTNFLLKSLFFGNKL